MNINYIWVALNMWLVEIFLLCFILILLYNWRCWHREQPLFRKLYGEKENHLQLQENLSVSVIVAVWNEAQLIERHIRSFLRLSYPNKELILCAGGDDGTYTIAQKYANASITVIEQLAGEGKQRSLQRCLKYVNGDIVYLVDADSELDDDSFVQIIDPLTKQGVLVASGMTKPLPEQMQNLFVLYQWYAEQYAATRLGQFTSLLRGCNAALYREVLEGVGGFSDQIWIGTDDHLSQQLQNKGHSIQLVRTSMIANEYPRNCKGYLQQQTRWLRVAILRSFTINPIKAWPTWMGFLIYCTPALLMVVGLFAGMLFCVFGLLMIIHMLCVRIRIVRFGKLYIGGDIRRRGYIYLVWYLLIDMYIRIISLVQLFYSRTRLRW